MSEDDNKRNNSEQPKLDDLISVRAASELSDLSQSYIRRLVSQGDIWGMKLGRNWVLDYFDLNLTIKKPNCNADKLHG